MQQSSTTNPQYGLLGRKLSHSYSPAIHAMLGEYPYKLFEIEPENVEAFIKNGPYAGLNVTIPYKQTAYSCCDELSPAARKLGNVNTLLRMPNGKLFGDNTDYYGFSHLLDTAEIDVAGQKALVLGSGGASKTAQAVLADKGAEEIIVVSRSGENNYDNLDQHRDAAVIVNATPVGMYPNCPNAPLNLNTFAPGSGASKLRGVVDLVYNPERTGLMLQAEKLGIAHASGLDMLVAQAKASSELWQNKVIPDTRISEITRKIKAKSRNIVLIGMPSCGKSTLGALLAKKLNRPFADLDEEIAHDAGMSIPQIFAQSGEEAFRDLETKACERLGKQSGLVISCGGGVVEKARNYDPLHQNGTIVLVKRPLESLVDDGRPVSKEKGIEAIAMARGPLYDAWADATIINDASPASAVEAICRALGVASS